MRSLEQLPFILVGDPIAEIVGVIGDRYPVYPINIFNVGRIGCNVILAITSPILNGFGCCLCQNVG